MIATVAFSVILLTITYGVLSFTNAYYKGINSSTTQNTARSIMDTITQAVQFSGSGVVPTNVDSGTGNSGVTYFCANNQVYTYRPGAQYRGDAATSDNPGLLVTTGSCVPPSPTDYSSGKGKQLLGPHMRIAVLTVTPDINLSQAYTVSIRLVYSSGGALGADGDDLLCSNGIDSGVGSCTAGSGNLTLTNYALGPNDLSTDVANKVVCRLQTGSQFCAVSALSSTVSERVNSN